MNPADVQYYHPTRIETMPDTDLIILLIERIGTPAITLAAAGYLIMWLLRNAAAERDTWQKRDEMMDERIMKLVEASSDALIHVKNSLDQNTQAMKELLYRK